METTLCSKGFRGGMKDSLPIFLGYLSVSFAFGMMAVQNGLPPLMAVLISGTNFTSAGQVAGTSLMLSGAWLLEIALTTFIINIRYMLMSLSLSQRLDPQMTLLERCILAFGNTDEVFAVAMQQQGLIRARYLAGLIVPPYIGWLCGTFLGSTAASVLPQSVRTALGIAIYGMFIAIVVPPAKRARPILIVVALSAVISCVFRLTPGLRALSAGWVIIISAAIASAICALRFPTTHKEEVAE